MKQVIHICRDQKFIGAVKYQFDKIYENNFYYLVKDDNIQHHAKVAEDKKTKLITYEELSILAKDIEPETVVIFHSVVNSFFDAIKKLKNKCTLVWIFFGMEIYNDSNIYSPRKLYGSKSRGFLPNKKVNHFRNIKNDLKPYIRILKPNLTYSKQEIKKRVLNSFDYLGIVYKEEYFNILKKTKIKNPNYLFFTYYPLEFIININEPINFNKNKVMIGNSGHLTNNHFDVFSKLQKYDLNDKEVVLPLGYGDPNYINEIVNNTKGYLNSDINFITDFLELEAYNKILAEVETFILYTRRQQGIGNIIALLWHGAKVFLSKRNTFYHYLKRINVTVYCYETDLNKNSIKSGLNKDKIKHNRKILYDYLNEETVLNKLKLDFKTILDN